MQNGTKILDEADRLEREGRYERALLVLGSVPAAVGARGDVLCRRGLLLYRLGRYEEAVEVLQKAGTHAQGKDLVRKCMEEKAAVLEGLGHYEAAASAQEALVSQSPTDARGLINQGITYAMADNYEQALLCFDRAIALDPDNETAWYNKGIALLDLGRVEGALNCFERTIRINRSNALAWHQKAVCLLQQAENAVMPWSRGAKQEEARQCLGKALRVNPNLQEARALLNSMQA